MSYEIELKDHLGDTPEDKNDSSNKKNEKKEKKIKLETYHPFVFIFYILFKILPIFSYVFIFFFFSEWFIVCFSITLFCLAIDFWYTKNVAGRLLCGLKWWNKIHDDGHSEWMFECLSNEKRVRLSKFEVITFWVGIFVSNLYWVLCVLTCTLSFKPAYLVLVIIAMVLYTTNTVGFIICYNTQIRQMSKKVTEKVVQEAMNKSIKKGMKNAVENVSSLLSKE